MRTLCDVCESAAAILFCPADEAALCSACDVKVHMCNKLANRHVRVGLAEPSEVQRCDICENEPAFFYCEVDGTSLCLQCDMIVHVGGKRTHGRYLLLRQRVEFPGDKPVSLGDPGLERGNLVENKMEPARASSFKTKEAHQNRHVSFGPDTVNNEDMENNMIDLNARPQRMHGEAPHNQDHVHTLFDINHESEPEGVVPD